MLSTLAARVQTSITRHRMLGPQDSILVGLSGGADSVSLVLVLKELGYRIAIAHLNHGLRGAAADEDEEFTRALAKHLGVPFFSRKVSIDGETGNLEAAGRAMRKAFFRETAESGGFNKVALAHTRDDRAETFLMNLFRGAGIDGLVSMAPVSGTTVRPLIDVTRNEVEAFLRESEQTWRTDLTNFDPAFARNRLRHSILPMLAAEFNPRIAETLSRTVEILEGEDAWMKGLTKEWLREFARFDSDGGLMNVTALRAVPIGMLRRLIRSALRLAGSSLQDVSFDHIGAVESLLGPGKSGKCVGLPGGVVVSRSFDELIFRHAAQRPAAYEYVLKIPGRIHIPELGKTFSAQIIDKNSVQQGPERVFVDGGTLGPYVRIRNWKPGDYYRPVGLPAGKLKKLFQRARIPRHQRASWPVLVANSKIVWVASFPISREFAPGERSQKIVAFEASPS